jgi:serine/threonine protein kinase
MKFDFLKNLFEAKKRVPKTDITRRFELIGRVGQGSMSRVWRARDTMSGKIVALKVLDKDKTKRFESRFAPELNKPSEGEVAMTLKHPNIVTTYEWGMTTDGEQFLVMEFIDGLGLSYLVDVQNDVMQKNRLSFIIQLGEAIRYFHDQKWIHRDICPRNVMVGDSDHLVKLIDFGLVVPNTPPFQAPGNRTGTANYMAPELIKRQRTDQRIDIFSYAMTCFEMFTKTFPWKAAESIEAVLQHINSPPHDIREFAPRIDEQVASTIMKGLLVNPKDRWQAIGPMLYQFREAQERLSPSKSDKSKRAARAAAASPAKVAPCSKSPPKPTPGITLAEEGITVVEEGITLAEDQSNGAPVPAAKAGPTTPGITLAEEGITLAEDQSGGLPAAPGNAGPSTPGITLAEEQPPDKRRSSTPGITVADDGTSSASHNR